MSSLYEEIMNCPCFYLSDAAVMCTIVDTSAAKKICDEVDKSEVCFILSWLEYGDIHLPLSSVIDVFKSNIEAGSGRTTQLKLVRTIQCHTDGDIRKCLMVTFVKDMSTPTKRGEKNGK